MICALYIFCIIYMVYAWVMHKDRGHCLHYLFIHLFIAIKPYYFTYIIIKYSYLIIYPNFTDSSIMSESTENKRRRIQKRYCLVPTCYNNNKQDNQQKKTFFSVPKNETCVVRIIPPKGERSFTFF